MKAFAALLLLVCAGCDYPTSKSSNTYTGPGNPPTLPAPPMITTTALPDAMVGQPYSAYLDVSGGIVPYAYTVTAGTLPQGLSLALHTGVIAGTPVDTGAFNVTFRVATPNGTNERALTLNVQ